jgi:hypothetical protein
MSVADTWPSATPVLYEISGELRAVGRGDLVAGVESS